jgi:hypothetical protein
LLVSSFDKTMRTLKLTGCDQPLPKIHVPKGSSRQYPFNLHETVTFQG